MSTPPTPMTLSSSGLASAPNSKRRSSPSQHHHDESQLSARSSSSQPPSPSPKANEVAEEKMDETTITKTVTTATANMFPHKLYQMLQDVEKDGNETIISWLSDGISFKVHNRLRFEQELMPKYFGSSKYRSFQKNLNLWGFLTVLTPLSNPHRGEVSNPNFLKGCPAKLQDMKRIVKSKLKKQQGRRVPQEVVLRTPKISSTSASSDRMGDVNDDSNISRLQQQQSLLQAVAAATLLPPQHVPGNSGRNIALSGAAAGKQKQEEEALRLLESFVLSRRIAAASDQAAKKNHPAHAQQSSAFHPYAHSSLLRTTPTSPTRTAPSTSYIDSPLVKHIRRHEEGGHHGAGASAAGLMSQKDLVASSAATTTEVSKLPSFQVASRSQDQEELLRSFLLRGGGGVAGVSDVTSRSLSSARSLLDQALAVSGTESRYNESKQILGISSSSSSASAATAASRNQLLLLQQGLSAATTAPPVSNSDTAETLEDLLRMRQMNRLKEAEAAVRLLQQQQPPRRSLHSYNPEQQQALSSSMTTPTTASTSTNTSSGSAAEMLRQLYQMRALNVGRR